MTKINPDLSVILIDTSYWLYYRFFSLRNWYSHAYPEHYVSDGAHTANFNANHNWLEDELFVVVFYSIGMTTMAGPPLPPSVWLTYVVEVELVVGPLLSGVEMGLTDEG